MAKTARRRRFPWKKVVLWGIVGLVVLLGAIQLVPYGRDHTNPPASNPFKWADTNAEAMARRSCYDCHSNETDWWWATTIAPFSWLVQNDVNEGRENVNFSDWQGGPTAQGLQGAINDGMPPFQYVMIHWGAKLSAAEKKTLVDGFGASLSTNGGTAPTPTPSATASSSPQPFADAVKIIDSRCGACHSTQIVVDYTAASADEAAQLIDDMVQRGANVNDVQKQTLVEYFTR